MKLNFFSLSLIFIMTLSFVGCSQQSVKENDIISIEGTWQLQTHPENIGKTKGWYKNTLPDKINLPGSCREQGFGKEITTPVVGKLTPVRKYDGIALFRRTIDIPKSWEGKRVELFLERCFWESKVWVDDVPVGTQNSISTPHIYSLGELKPGEHILTISVDNRYKLPIGTWTSAITDDTQGRWNGIIGKIELKATDLVWIEDVQVYADHLKINVGNATGKDIEAQIDLETFKISKGGSTVTLPFTKEAGDWDEFTPQLHQKVISLKADKWSDSYRVKYAVRDLITKDKQFVLNNKPVYMRGPVDECVYPLTGYPPMDKEAWIRIIEINKSYGFNFMRFHSWCPPNEAFEAADELGFFFQVELPLWTMDAPHYGEHAERDKFIQDELDLILKTYGNHPSFAFMAMGNESVGSLDELVIGARDKDPRHLYRCENGSTKENGDFFETGERGNIGPRTDWDRQDFFPGSGWIAGGSESDRVATRDVPTFSHEVGQWAMYPDLNQVDKFTGIYRAEIFNSYRKSLKEHNMLDQAEAFSKASGTFSVLLYKDEIEASLRTYPYGGFQILEARDYLGQGIAVVGWLDAFWDSKGLITPEKFREFCGPTVCLVKMPKRVYTADESFVAQTEIAHYEPEDLDVTPKWSISNTEGEKVANGTLKSARIETGKINQLEDINVSLSNVNAPSKLIVTLSAAGTSNSWDIWVYPAKNPDTKFKDVIVSYAFDKKTKEALSNGKSVLLLASPEEGLVHFKKGMMQPESVWTLPKAQPGKNAIPGSFMPVFWNLRLFNQIGTIGTLSDPTHPAFAEFPTDGYSNWQWADLIGHFSAANSFRVAGAPEELSASMEKASGDVGGRSKAIILDDTPADFRPILQVIDTYHRNSKLGTIFECKVGKGKLLVCAIDLDTDADKRPAARQLKYSLKKYIGSDKFEPTHSLSVELLDKLLLDK
ncbi:MAG: hypothetical protein KAH25_04945 [Bacteroidales bacterium]|nr:hypothetical protein [Bacteroidales bacterium]